MVMAQLCLPDSVTGKKSPNVSIKVAQKYFTRKLKDFDTYTKIA